MPSNQTAQEAAAAAKFAITDLPPSQVVAATHQVASVVKAHPDFGNKPDIQKEVESWVGAADLLDKDREEIETTKLKLSALVAKSAKDFAAWKRATKKMVATVEHDSDGSAEAIKKWGFMVAERQPVAPTTAAPDGLRSVFRKDFSLVLRWNAVPDHLGYLLQMGDGSPEGWGAPITCTRAKHAPAGLQPGQKVAFRVAVQRRTGQSAWSDTLVVTAR